MTGFLQPALGEYAVAESRGPLVPALPTFDIRATVISEYANSDVLLAVVDRMGEWIDPSANFDLFYASMYDIDTATGYGLDVWGRKVGVTRVLHLPVDDDYFGFSEADDSFGFGEGIFYHGDVLTSNYALSDLAFRRLIFAKALSNISDGSIGSINQILVNLFHQYGNCFVTDGGDMTMTYTFGATLDPVDYAIVAQSGVLPRPAGVSATIVQP